MIVCKSFCSLEDHFYLHRAIDVIKCHLSRLMGERKVKIADVSRDTGINRGTLTRLYQETAERIDLEVIDKLCDYFGCQAGDLLEHRKKK